jgi:hypothetical protein
MMEGSMGRTKIRKLPMVAVAAWLMMLATAAVSHAQIPGVVANQPGASLLLPYFEVDLNNNTMAADTTVMAIYNASAQAALSHVVIYSDLGVPAFGFDVYLTGYGVWRLNLQQLLLFGTMPQRTAPGNATYSPVGPDSYGASFTCPNLPITAALSPSVLAGLQAALTGQPSVNFGNNCLGQNLGDNIARGYITVDTTNACTSLFPGDTGYFGGGGVVINQNVLSGDVIYTNPSHNRAVTLPLVSLIADASNPATSTSGAYTFYGKYDGFTAVDNRQPTSTSFFARYILAGSPQALNFANDGTSGVVWRDAKINQGPFTCGSPPSWYPLLEEGIVVFDEQEHPAIPPVCLRRPCPVNATAIPFPAQTQKVTTGGVSMPVPFNAGIAYLDLNTNVTGESANLSDQAAAQAWVIQFYDQVAGDHGNNNSSTWEMGERATLLDSAENAMHFVP